MRELLGFLHSAVIAPLSLDGEAILFALFVFFPAVFGLVVTLGDWRAVLKAFLVWFGGLVAVFFLMSGSLGGTLYGALVYGMFFSIVAVPLIALLIKVGGVVRHRLRTGGTGA
ncbi:MAG: hypothetical protein KDJ77_09985 [Rhodobiaceae bacterium]|nr:hypothetical protein [Rhodobiaceae bacterium]